MVGESKKEVIPNANDMRFITTVMANQTKASKLEVDWQAVADELGLKNRACAQTRFNQINKKLGWNMGAKGGKGSTPSTPESGGRAVNKLIAGSASPSTPSKVTKATGRVGTKGKTAKFGVDQKKTDAEQQSDDDDNDDDEEPESNVKEEPEANVKEEPEADFQDVGQNDQTGNTDGASAGGFDFSKAIV